MEKLKRQIFNVLLTCMMVMVIGYCMSMTVKAESEYDIYVITQEGDFFYVTAENKDDVLGDGGSVRYTPASATEPRTLTFTNATIGEVAQYDDNIGVSDNSLLRIVFAGDNSFYVGDEISSSCIGADAPLLITGTGKAIFVSEYYDAVNEEGFGCIESETELTISGVELIATATYFSNAIYSIGDLNITDGAKVTVNSINYPGLWSAGNMNITDSTVISSASEGNGIWCDGQLTIDGTSVVEVSAHTDYYTGIGTNAGLEIGDSAKVKINSCYYGLLGDYSNADDSIIINDSAQLEVVSSYYGIYGVNTSNIEIGGNAVVSINSTYGVWSVDGGDFNITGGDVTVYGSEYAIVTKPELGQYANAVIFAGADEEAAVQVEESSDYHYEKYVRIQHSHQDTNSDGKCDVCNAFMDGIGVRLAGYSLSLDGNIGVNFYMELTDDAVNNPTHYKMQFTLGNETTDVALDTEKTAVIEETTYYIFTYEVAAKEMADTITAQMVYTNGNDTRYGKEYTYSVKEYADALINRDGATEEEIALAKALLNYGAYAEIYFEGNTSIGADTPSVTITEDVYNKYKASVTDNSDKVEYLGSTLLLESKIKVRHYFSTDAATAGKNSLEEYGTGIYYYESAGIAAAGMGAGSDCKVDELIVNYSPMSYVVTVLANVDKNAANAQELVGDTDLQNLMKALYLYYEAVLAYNNLGGAET